VSPRFVLGSGSPRRRQLLEEAGYEFEVVEPAVTELSVTSLTIRELTICNAARKALAIARSRPDAIVLGADTLVALDGEVIGKPDDLAHAEEILRRLSGRSHEVRTAAFICHFARGQSHSFQEVSHVQFRKLDRRAISKYLARINPLDKAGAYAAQGHGAEIIERIEGSYSNVVGLPMEETTRVLRLFGIKPARAGSHSATVALSRQQTSSLFPSGSSKKTA
jgi:septum formation protein